MRGRRDLRLWLLALLAAVVFLPAVPGRAAPPPSNVPYSLGGPLPAPVSSPSVDPKAPYTPLVESLIQQLEPTNPPTLPELTNAARLFDGSILVLTGNTECTAVGGVGAPVGTTPGISPLCFADSVGVNILAGPNQGHTTATPEPLAIGSTFDPALANAWGQVEGVEGRRLMVTGLFGPEADVSIYPNWERGLDTLGEDPYVNNVMTAAQVNGMQGRGLMAEVKHFAAFTGDNRFTLTQVQDQPLHEMLLTPFESAFTSARAAATMCAYDLYQDTSTGLPGPQNALAPRNTPYSTSPVKTWPLNEAHWSCEQPLALDYVLRGLWHSAAFVGSDYPAIHSTAAMTQGAAQEFPQPAFFFNTDPSPDLVSPFTVGNGTDPTGDGCASAGLAAPCTQSGAQHVGGIPGPGCEPLDGCGLVNAVATGNLPLAVFNQALAEILYQEQRFGLLGCNDSPPASTCTNPGGVGGTRTGLATLPQGPASGASARFDLGTEDGDAAVAERLAEEGAVLLVNHRHGLPLTSRALRRGVAVSGPGAEYLVAEPSDEASTGFPDRISVSPLAQLKALSGRPGAFTYTAAQSPTGEPVPATQLSTTSGQVDGGLERTAGPGSPRKDATLDFTAASPAGQLAPGDYSWSGYLYVPRGDTYTFRVQFSPGAGAGGSDPVGLSLDGSTQQLSAAGSFYCGQYYPTSPVCVPVSPTNPGYTEGGLTNEQTAGMQLSAGYHQVSLSFHDDSGSPASFRFAYSRSRGDIADAAASARGKAAAVVFVNDDAAVVVNQDAYTPPSRGVTALPDQQVALIEAVASANPNTIVVMNTADPVIVQPWVDNPHVRAVLEMWNAGSEGGTATARLLLGQADPSGHTVITWPRRSTDTIWGFRETHPLYPGDHTGAHPERLNGLTDSSQADCSSYTPAVSPCTKTILTQGIFSGYRFYDQEALAPEFPFGFGLSYTTFRFAHLRLARAAGGVDATLSIANTGGRAGADVVQVYVGPGPPVAGVQQAVRSLGAFARVQLAPRETKRVTVHVGARALEYWSDSGQRWQLDPGSRTIWVGDADSPSRLPLHSRVVIR